MTERAKRCGNCGAWRALTVDDDAIAGVCRRHPPVREYETDSWGPMSRWPQTYTDDWCLNWLPREADDGGET